MDNSKNLTRLRELSEKSGIEMIVINEAEKITNCEAIRFTRRLILSSYIDDPIKCSFTQGAPKEKTVELPGVSFLIDNSTTLAIIGTLNKRFTYRQCLAFISDQETRHDKKNTVSLIHSADKYNALRLQETSGGSYQFSTDSIISKLIAFEEKYPFDLIGVGDDWLSLQIKNTQSSWLDIANEISKICPLDDETDIDQYADFLKYENGIVFLWWD